MARGGPTSENLARAFLLAADALGEGPRLAAMARRGWTGARLLQSRWVVLYGTYCAFPHLGLEACADMVGVAPERARHGLTQMPRATWWSWDLVQAVFFAVTGEAA